MIAVGGGSWHTATMNSQRGGACTSRRWVRAYKVGSAQFDYEDDYDYDYEIEREREFHDVGVC